MVVITYGDVEVEVEEAERRDDDTWLELEGLPSAIGWDVRPEGVCAGELCVPVPPGETWWDDSHFNLSAFARHIGLTEAADHRRGVVAFVEPNRAGPASGGDPDPGGGPASVDAPDFTLPDLDGNLHSLSEHRGEKVVLLTWASF